MKIIVKESPLHGLGVFACIDFAAGDVIERCPYLVIDDDDLQEINRLNDYLFTSPDDKNDYLCVLGCGMIYNHGAPPNAEWQIDDDVYQAEEGTIFHHPPTAGHRMLTTENPLLAIWIWTGAIHGRYWFVGHEEIDCQLK